MGHKTEKLEMSTIVKVILCLAVLGASSCCYDGQKQLFGNNVADSDYINISEDLKFECADNVFRLLREIRCHDLGQKRATLTFITTLTKRGDGKEEQLFFARQASQIAPRNLFSVLNTKIKSVHGQPKKEWLKNVHIEQDVFCSRKQAIRGCEETSSLIIINDHDFVNYEFDMTALWQKLLGLCVR